MRISTFAVLAILGSVPVLTGSAFAESDQVLTVIRNYNLSSSDGAHPTGSDHEAYGQDGNDEPDRDNNDNDGDNDDSDDGSDGDSSDSDGGDSDSGDSDGGDSGGSDGGDSDGGSDGGSDD